MTILQLQYFIEVAKLGNVTKAAETLNISQSALSQTIKKLEDEFSATFFQRFPKNMILTDAGNLFLNYAQKTLQQWEEINHQLSKLDTQLHGTIFVQSNPIPYLIAEQFLKFRRNNPMTKIQFVSVPALLINDYSKDPFQSVSLLITSEPPAEDQAERHILFQEKLMAALPRSHRLANRAHIHLSELRNEPFLLYEKGEIQKAVERCCAAAGFTPYVHCVCHDLATMFNLVAAGEGVSLFPETWKQLCNDNSVLVPLEEHCSRTIYLCCKKSSDLDPTAKAFRDFLIAQSTTNSIYSETAKQNYP